MSSGAHESRRYLGLDLAGAKNHKTSLAVLEFFPKEKKTFLLDIFEKIGLTEKVPVSGEITGDRALLELVEELKPGIAKVGVNVPLELPPCIQCTRKTCPTAVKCTVPALKWMRDHHRKSNKSKDSDIRILEFTPYTQRPVELWVRYLILPRLSEAHRFEVDEALGGNRAPLTARMHYLRRHLDEIELSEIWPKLSVAIFAEDLGVQKRTIARYRQLEEGSHAREEIIEALAERYEVFIYERDVRKLSQSLGAFDAFICAFTALLSDVEACEPMPHGFPQASQWIQIPALSKLSKLGSSR